MTPHRAEVSPGPAAVPRIAVVMSAHNEAPFVDAAVASVLAQSLADFEFIIRDDGSTDDTGRLLETWARRDPRIRLFRDDVSLGLAEAGNFVVRQARADLIARMDADDIAHPGWLQRLHDVISRRPDAVLVGCLWSGIDSSGRPVRVADRWRAAHPSIFPPFGHGSSMFRRAAWERTGGYRPECTYWEDYDLVLRLARLGTILFAPDVLYHYRFSSSSTRRTADQARVERAIETEMACVAAYRRSGDYEAVLAGAEARGEAAPPISARTLVALSSNRVWNAERPRRLARIAAGTRWPPSRQEVAQLALAAASEISPRGARAILAAIIRLRGLRTPAPADGEPVVWDPLAGIDTASRLGRAAGALGLVTASCAPPGDARVARLKAAASRSIEPSALVNLAAWHRVAPFVSAAVAEEDIAVPAEAVRPLAIQAARARFQAQRNAAEEARLASAARAAGLDLLFLKGASLAALIHRDPAAKTAWDIDVLIAPNDLPAARSFLESAGYTVRVPAGIPAGRRLDRWLAETRESLWLNDARGTAVELHLSLCESPGMLPGIGMASPRQQVIVAGAPLSTLAEAELFAFLCVHGTTHAWARLKWLADVAALVAASDRDPAQLDAAAVSLGGGRCSAVALLLCRHAFGLVLPPGLEQRLSADPITRRLVRDSWRAMDRIGDPDRRLAAETLPEIVAAMRRQYRLAPGLRYRWRTFRSQVMRPYAASQLAVPRLLLPAAMLVWLPARLALRPWRRGQTVRPSRPSGDGPR